MCIVLCGILHIPLGYFIYILDTKLSSDAGVGAGKPYHGKVKSHDKSRVLPRGPVDRWEENMMANVLGGQNHDDDLELGRMRRRKNILDEYNGNEDDSVFNQGGQHMFRFQPVVTPRVDRRGKSRWPESNLVKEGGVGGGVYPEEKLKKTKKSYPKLALDDNKIEDGEYDYLNERDSKILASKPKPLKILEHGLDVEKDKDRGINRFGNFLRDRKEKHPNNNFQIKSDRQFGKNVESPLQKKAVQNERHNSPVGVGGQIRRKQELQPFHGRKQGPVLDEPDDFPEHKNFPQFQEEELELQKQKKLLDALKNKYYQDREPNTGVDDQEQIVDRGAFHQGANAMSEKSKYDQRGNQIGMHQGLGNMDPKDRDVKVAPRGPLIQEQGDQKNSDRGKLGQLGQGQINSQNRGRLLEEGDQLRRVHRDTSFQRKALPEYKNQLRIREEQKISDLQQKNEINQEFVPRMNNQDKLIRNINRDDNMEGTYQNQDRKIKLKERKKKGIQIHDFSM